MVVKDNFQVKSGNNLSGYLLFFKDVQVQKEVLLPELSRNCTQSAFTLLPRSCRC